MTFGERVRYYRERIGMTQGELAERLGYSDKGSVSRIESDQTDLPRSKVVLIAEVFGISPVSLMGLDEPEPEPAFIDPERKYLLDQLHTMTDDQVKQLSALWDVINRESHDQ